MMASGAQQTNRVKHPSVVVESTCAAAANGVGSHLTSQLCMNSQQPSALAHPQMSLTQTLPRTRSSYLMLMPHPPAPAAWALRCTHSSRLAQ